MSKKRNWVDEEYGAYAKIKVRLDNRSPIIIDSLDFCKVRPIAIQIELIEQAQKVSWIGMLLEHTEDEIQNLELRELVKLLGSRSKDPPQWMLHKLLRSIPKWRRLNLQRQKLSQLMKSLEHRGRILQNQSSLIKRNYS